MNAMLKHFGLAGVAVVACAIALSAARQDASPPRVGECVFAHGGETPMFANLWTAGEGDRIRALLDEHHLEHGWNDDVEGPDFFDAGRGALCPDAVLDQVAAVSGIPDENAPVCISLQLAFLLERNGRAEQSLSLLDNALVRAQAAEDLSPGRRGIGLIPRQRARLAAHQGLWERALVYAQAWEPSEGFCGTIFLWDSIEIRDFKLRCLLGLERYDEAVAMIRAERDEGSTSLGSFSAVNAETWIACELALGRAKDADQATAMIVAQVTHEDAPTCLEGRRLYDLARQPREVQAAHLSLLASKKPEQALALLVEGGSPRVAAQLRALDLLMIGYVRDPQLALLMVETGDPSLAAKLESGDKRLELLRGKWLTAQARYRALTTSR
jgi:hypothetical protein